MPCVNQNTGQVDPSKFHMFKNWNPEYTMEKVLIGLKNEMISNKKAAQPADGDMFWASKIQKINREQESSLQYRSRSLIQRWCYKL